MHGGEQAATEHTGHGRRETIPPTGRRVSRSQRLDRI
jgi:hypothetical protein